MDLRQLEYVVAVADRGTFMAAAEHLHVAQPALWKRVRDLERELGVVIFERAGRRVRLTSDGAQLVAVAMPVVAGADRVRDLARDLAAGLVGEVAVLCVPSHVPTFLAPVIGEFRQVHPRIRVDLHELGAAPSGAPTAAAASSGGHGSASLLDALRSGAVDIITSPPLTGAVQGFHVYDVHVVLVPPPRHKWRTQQTVSVTQLADVPLVVTPRGFLSRTLLDNACNAAGFEPMVAAESANAATLVALGENGVGVPVIASDALPARISSERRPSLTVRGHDLSDEVWMYWRAGSTPTPAVESFLDIARHVAKRIRS